MTGWVSASLTEEHDLAHFDCGNAALNDWLRNQALRSQQANTARTYVWTVPGDPVVVAYYSVAPTQILRAELSGGQAGGYSVVPAYLLARLALDRTLHGQGLGAEVLVDALQVMVTAASVGGGRLIVVDAIDDPAAKFYRHHDFQPVKGNPNRLVMKVSTARKALGAMSFRVTRDPGTELTSIVMEMPDGTTVPVVASRAEIGAIADRLETAAESSTTHINLRHVMREVLGRDPFDIAKGAER